MKFIVFSIFHLSERDDSGPKPGDNSLETHIPPERVLRIPRVLSEATIDGRNPAVDS